MNLLGKSQKGRECQRWKCSVRPTTVFTVLSDVCDVFVMSYGKKTAVLFPFHSVCTILLPFSLGYVLGKTSTVCAWGYKKLFKKQSTGEKWYIKS